MLTSFYILVFHLHVVVSYSNLFSISKFKEDLVLQCSVFNNTSEELINPISVQTSAPPVPLKKRNQNKDIINYLEVLVNQVIYGPKAGNPEVTIGYSIVPLKGNDVVDVNLQYPTGDVMRVEQFQNTSSVHMPLVGWIHRGHCRLNVTNDYMQTAVNAFFIFLEGNLNDILKLPQEYVLNSARTISMMKLTREKLVATWTVVKAGRTTKDVPYEILEKYRPLLKHLSGSELARLNLLDDRILTYLGTHAELNRHQVGVIASEYIKQNKSWMKSKYLNLMNNILCGVPITLMRKIPDTTYLQLSHQVFYHIRACDPVQRRFYLGMMTKPQVLGKSYSWKERDVARLGLLLAVVEGRFLTTIKPEAMSGITAHVMQEMEPENLWHLTDEQLQYIPQNAFMILVKKMKAYQHQQQASSCGRSLIHISFIFLTISTFISIDIME